MGNNLSYQPPVIYGPGLNQTFSILGAPASYIQVDENSLKQCLNNQTNQDIINSCINKNVFAPSVNGGLTGVNVWNGTQLPPNHACIKQHNKPQPTIIFAPKLPQQVINSLNSGSNPNYFENFELDINNHDFRLIVFIIIVLLIVFLTK